MDKVTDSLVGGITLFVLILAACAAFIAYGIGHQNAPLTAFFAVIGAFSFLLLFGAFIELIKPSSKPEKRPPTQA